jgi:RND family efflux transporter MFP subunit
MAEDKAKLLRSLAIDRGPDGPGRDNPGRDTAVRKATPRPARRRWPAILGALGGVAVALLLVAVLLPELRIIGRNEQAVAQQQPTAAPPPAAVAAEARRPGSLVASGYVVARRKATVAAEITGKVIEILIEEGMVVQAGQVVARLDSVLAEKDLALARSRVESSEAAIAMTTADLEEATRILTRTRSLSQKNFASEADLTKAESRVGMLTAQLRQSQSQRETARLDAQRTEAVLDKHQVRAPFGGVVVDRSAQPGEMISPLSAGGGFTRTGVCTIVDMDSIEIEVDVNEAFIGRVSAGNRVNAVLDAYPDWTIPASVIAVVPTANREKATVKVRIGLLRKDPRILPDMAVKVTFLDEGAAATARKDASAAN